MENFKNVIMFVVSNYELILAAISMILSGIIMIAILIPGPQPEKFLQGVVNLIAKISVKKKTENIDQK